MSVDQHVFDNSDSDSDSDTEEMRTVQVHKDVDLIKVMVFLHTLADWFEDLLLMNAAFFRHLNMEPELNIVPVINPVLRTNAYQLIYRLLQGIEEEVDLLYDIMEEESDFDSDDNDDNLDNDGDDDDEDDDNEDSERDIIVEVVDIQHD